MPLKIKLQIEVAGEASSLIMNILI